MTAVFHFLLARKLFGNCKYSFDILGDMRRKLPLGQFSSSSHYLKMNLYAILLVFGLASSLAPCEESWRQWGMCVRCQKAVSVTNAHIHPWYYLMFFLCCFTTIQAAPRANALSTLHHLLVVLVLFNTVLLLASSSLHPFSPEKVVQNGTSKSCREHLQQRPRTQPQSTDRWQDLLIDPVNEDTAV